MDNSVLSKSAGVEGDARPSSTVSTDGRAKYRTVHGKFLKTVAWNQKESGSRCPAGIAAHSSAAFLDKNDLNIAPGHLETLN